MTSCAGRTSRASCSARARRSDRDTTRPIVASMIAGEPGAAAAREPNLSNIRTLRRIAVNYRRANPGPDASMTDLRRRLKELLIERLKFEDMTADDIADDEPLFNGGLGLDSIDALEIVVMLESEFGIRVKSEGSAREHFRSIATLADFVEARLAQQQNA